MNVNVFKAIADIATGAKKRQDAEYTEFLAFYRELVETLPTEAVKLFGACARVVIPSPGAKEETWHLNLTATDFMWWKAKIEQVGARFKNGTVHARIAMLDQLAKKAEAQTLSVEERKALLSILDEAQGDKK